VLRRERNAAEVARRARGGGVSRGKRDTVGDFFGGRRGEQSRGPFLPENVSHKHARAGRERVPLCFRVRWPLPCACRTCILTAALNGRVSVDDAVDGERVGVNLLGRPMAMVNETRVRAAV
jgi:hypothetical protein